MRHRGREALIPVRAEVSRSSTSSDGMHSIARGAVAAIAAGSLLVMPFMAGAVSGGGGISVPLSNEDFSGQNLTKNSYTKAVLRQTNFSNCNLR